MSDTGSAQVLIVGAGPVGLTLANLLGKEGISTVLVELNPGTVPEPRAIALDGESLRTLQAVGLADIVTATLREGFVADYVNGEGTELFTTDLNPRPYGFCLQNSFDQPTLENQLLEGLSRFHSVTVCFDTRLESFSQEAAGVTVRLRNSMDEERTLRCDFLVGCDGGRSTVREGLAVAMHGDRLPQRWLVIDTVDTYLTGDPECRFYCDPARPAMTMLRPGGERRWEWMLLEGEHDDSMLEDEVIRQLLKPHTNPDCVEIYRKVVYGFSAVVAEKFSEGRVFLAGDAAHMTPPFAGQGLNAGVRDVRNLSWKLAAVLRDGMAPSILHTYNLERHDAAQEIVNLAVVLGDQIQPTDVSAAAERDGFFAELNKTPGAGAKFGSDLVAPLHDVRMNLGWFVDDGFGGRFLPQPMVERHGQLERFDESLGDGFTVLLPPGGSIPAATVGHRLWGLLSPQVRELPAELQDFMGDSNAALLLRPDRFVLAQLPLNESASAVLDELEEGISEAV
ncbi:3-(3-hydroxy-phenyl)propionate hydroxylase [gamma proteobacterium NOR5-3]|nr:3-(3-hydroxy-phenyl)propionate hydroxylase [gamma proteobacterium NOR5-3]